MAGRIELITGPMCSGKSKELIMRRKFYQGSSIAPIILIPDLIKGSPNIKISDISGGEVVNMTMHDGHKYAAARIGNLEQTFDKIHGFQEGLDYYKNVTVAVDEVQFFDPSVVPILEQAAREWGWVVVCAGLDEDFAGRHWETVSEILAIADCLVRLRARCAVCGAPADRTQRLHLDGTPARADEPRIVVDDGSVRYEPRCWRCHVVA